MFLSFLSADPNERRRGTNRKGEYGVCKSVFIAVSVDVYVDVDVQAQVYSFSPGSRTLVVFGWYARTWRSGRSAW